MGSVEQCDVVVIGAGVVGLAVARALALSGREVLLLEAAGRCGTGVSSRNSEVIHAGIYYPTGSLKARLCVAGREALYPYCAKHGVPHRRLGKLLIATSAAELPLLASHATRAAANGVDDLVELSAQQAQALEPQVRCAGALLSPSTGIVDAHALMDALQADCEAHGGIVAPGSTVTRGELEARGVRLQVGAAEPTDLAARYVINCAGLSAQALSASLWGVPAASIPPLRLAKGHYFALSGRAPFSRLVYPMPDAGGLGIHVTLDLAGAARFGPDVVWTDRIDYDFTAGRVAAFVTAIRRYYPGLDAARLRPAYVGVRPKLSGPGEAAADFCVRGPSDHAGAPYLALYGIESPGLTAALAIGDYVAAMVIQEPARYSASTTPAAIRQ
jgi:L-2-hydroxyglutarate oxidase LhgO